MTTGPMGHRHFNQHVTKPYSKTSKYSSELQEYHSLRNCRYIPLSAAPLSFLPEAVGSPFLRTSATWTCSHCRPEKPAVDEGAVIVECDTAVPADLLDFALHASAVTARSVRGQGRWPLRPQGRRTGLLRPGPAPTTGFLPGT